MAAQVKGHHDLGELAQLQQKRNTLLSRIESWRKIQQIYMPMAAPLLSQMTAPTTSDIQDDDFQSMPRIRTEDIKLLLPSELPTQAQKGQLIEALLKKEAQLRIAQANDALNDIRRLRRVITGISQFKYANTSGAGQGPNTKIRSLYNTFQGKILLAAARYRTAYHALAAINPGGEWSTKLQELLDSDICGPGIQQKEDFLGQGNQEVSWIWRHQGASNSIAIEELEKSQEFNDSLRVEWSMSQARAKRWVEEVILLEEEMRRVLAYFEWKAHWWYNQTLRQSAESGLSSGLMAYAEKQAWIYKERAKRFAAHWMKLYVKCKKTPAWSDLYPNIDKQVVDSIVQGEVDD